MGQQIAVVWDGTLAEDASLKPSSFKPEEQKQTVIKQSSLHNSMCWLKQHNYPLSVDVINSNLEWQISLIVFVGLKVS